MVMRNEIADTTEYVSRSFDFIEEDLVDMDVEPRKFNIKRLA